MLSIDIDGGIDHFIRIVAPLYSRYSKMIPSVPNKLRIIMSQRQVPWASDNTGLSDIVVFF